MTIVIVIAAIVVVVAAIIFGILFGRRNKDKINRVTKVAEDIKKV